MQTKYTTEECLQEYCNSLENQLAEKDAMIDWLAARIPRDADTCADCMIGPDCGTCRRRFWRQAAQEAVKKNE